MNTIAEYVLINRTSIMSDRGWDQLIELAGDYAVKLVANEDNTEVRVYTSSSRGRGGSYSTHDLACRYGAIAVIRYDKVPATV